VYRHFNVKRVSDSSRIRSRSTGGDVREIGVGQSLAHPPPRFAEKSNPLEEEVVETLAREMQ